VRPVNHHRAFYWTLGPGRVVAFKGTEIVAADLDDSIARLARGRRFELRHLDHYPVRERKVPFALRLGEALREAENAALLQAAYVARYRALARVPLPLFVFRWSDDEVARFRGQLAPHLTRYVLDLVDELLASGLGVYVYYYPGIPLRVRELASPIDATLDAVDDWVKLVARILALGFFPCSYVQADTGQMIQDQNAVVDGGFVDTDSLHAMAEGAEPGEFRRHLAFSTRVLAHTIPAGRFGSRTHLRESDRLAFTALELDAPTSCAARSPASVPSIAGSSSYSAVVGVLARRSDCSSPSTLSKFPTWMTPRRGASKLIITNATSGITMEYATPYNHTPGLRRANPSPAISADSRASANNIPYTTIGGWICSEIIRVAAWSNMFVNAGRTSTGSAFGVPGARTALVRSAHISRCTARVWSQTRCAVATSEMTRYRSSRRSR